MDTATATPRRKRQPSVTTQATVLPPDTDAARNDVAAYEAPRPAPQTVLMRLFRMADGHRQRGEPNQAIEMFLELVEQHGQTPEGRMARECLMEICDEYERAGKTRQARALYERLL
jgi:hypothetical protein